MPPRQADLCWTCAKDLNAKHAGWCEGKRMRRCGRCGFYATHTFVVPEGVVISLKREAAPA